MEQRLTYNEQLHREVVRLLREGIGGLGLELDEEKIRSREGSVAGTGSVVGTPAASVAGSVVGDDAVMVESPSGKKKKGKK